MTGPQPSIALPERVIAALTRQVAWYERMLAELSALGTTLAGDDLAHAIDACVVHLSDIAQFHNELGELSRLWHESHERARRAEIADLAAQAQSLSVQVIEEYECAIRRVQERGASVACSLAALKKGRGLLVKYRPEVQRDSGRVDKKV